MSIVSSTFALEGPPERDGSQWVVETHTDNVGLKHLTRYRAALGVDKTAIMNARAIDWANWIQENEFWTIVQSSDKPVLNYQTAAQFAARYRQAYLSSSRDRTIYLAWWLVEQINSGNLTDAQVQNAFGLTTQQYTTLKANTLVPQHDVYNVTQTAVGQ